MRKAEGLVEKRRDQRGVRHLYTNFETKAASSEAAAVATVAAQSLVDSVMRSKGRWRR
jgi:hypothetical protein